MIVSEASSLILHTSTMSRAYQTFEDSIKDAEELLNLFNEINSQPPPPRAEVLKRAGLVMALTAWETYVEDRLEEAVSKNLVYLKGCYVGNFVRKKLDQDLKQFHNPTSDKCKRIFQEYLGFDDVTKGWKWSNFKPEDARKTLNEWISKRGEAVHRSKPATSGPPAPHLVKKEELEKLIRFIKDLVQASDKYIDSMLDQTSL